MLKAFRQIPTTAIMFEKETASEVQNKTKREMKCAYGQKGVSSNICFKSMLTTMDKN